MRASPAQFLKSPPLTLPRNLLQTSPVTRPFSIMDFDLLAEVLNEEQSGDLLSHLPDGTLNIDETPAESPLTANSPQPGAVVSKIEAIFETVAGCILDEKKKIFIKLKTRGKQSNTARDAITGTIKSLPDEETKMVQFPSKSPKEAWKFSNSLRS